MKKILLQIIIVVTSLIVIAMAIYVFPCITAQLTHRDWEYNLDTNNCQDFSIEAERFFESELHIKCLIVYGENKANNSENPHIWNIIYWLGEYREFEATCWDYQKVSDYYNIQLIQEGFYINGVRYNISQPLENWEEIKEKN